MEVPSNIIAFLLLFWANYILASGESSSFHHQSNDFHECLNEHLEGSDSRICNDDVIHTPKTASYESLLLAPNLRSAAASPQKPLLIITPFQEFEIEAAISCSKNLRVQVRIRSGGHDFEGLSFASANPFVIIDMRELRSIWINAEEKTAWVQVGATLGELYYAIAQKSKNLGFSAGTAPTVGVGGHLSGGGYGMMSRKHSIASDNIIDAILINANGQILDRKSMGEDLFWAIRGGGGTSFGIVLAFKVNLITVPDTVTVFNVSRTLEQNATQLVHKWQYIADKIEENLVIRLFLSSVSSSRNNRRTIMASFTSFFLGRVRDLLPIMQEKFQELGLVERDCTEMSWIESVLFFAGLHNQTADSLLSRNLETMYFKGKSDYVKQAIPESGLKGIWRFLNEEDENKAQLQFSPYGGVLNSYSESETPFPHRSGNIFMIEYAVLWYKPGMKESKRHIEWMNRLYSYMAPFVSNSPREAYANYRDLDIGMNKEGSTSYQEASVWGFKYFKNNFNRLVRVKTKVDAFNFFRNEQSIPPVPLVMGNSSWASHIC